MLLRAPTPNRTVLLVGRKDGPRLVAKWFLSHFGHKVECARTSAEALDLFNPAVHHVIVTGDKLSQAERAEFARAVGERSSKTPVLAMDAAGVGKGWEPSRMFPGAACFVGLKEAIDRLSQERPDWPGPEWPSG